MTTISLSDNFFKILYQFCDGQIEIRPLPSGRQGYFNQGDHTAMMKFCDSNKENDLYFAVATRAGGGRKENIVEIPAVWVDADFKMTSRETLKSNLRKFPFKPSIINLSGGGVHLYWILSEPTGQQDIPAVEDINRRIASALGGDPAACDASRVLRIPGTLNLKYDPPRMCKVAQINNFLYELNNFSDFLPERKQASGGKVSVNPRGWLAEAFSGVSSGTRNITGTKIAGYFVNQLSTDDILIIMGSWNLNNRPPLPEDDIVKIIRSVTKYKRISDGTPKKRIKIHTG